MGVIKLKNLILESVTVRVSGATDEYPELHTVMDIGFELGRAVLWPIVEKKFTPEEKEMFRSRGMGAEVIAPDGSDFDEPIGTINFYTAGIPERFIPFILKGIKDHLDMLGIEYGQFRGPEQSRMYKSMVIRIPITKNSMSKSEKAPELNMANRNFQVLFHNILNLVGDDDYSFTFPVKTIEKAIVSFVEGSDTDQMKKLEPHTIEPSKIEPEPRLPGDEWKEQSLQDKIASALGGTQYGMGLSVEQLSRYIFQLNNIVKWAKSKGYKTITGG